MNKAELIELINSLGLDKNEFYVVSSGALVLRGLLPDAGDLDISVSDEGLAYLKKKYNLTPKNSDNWYYVTDRVECVCNGDKSKWVEPQLCEGIYVQNINQYYEYLLTSDRDKDKARIPIVKEYIANLEKEKI